MNVKDYISSCAAVKYLSSIKSTVDDEMQKVIDEVIWKIEKEMTQYKVVPTEKMKSFSLDDLSESELIRMTTLRVRTLVLVDKDFAVRVE